MVSGEKESHHSTSPTVRKETKLCATHFAFFFFFSFEVVDDFILHSTKNHTSWEFGKSETHQSLQPNRRKRRRKKATEKKNTRIIDDDEEHVP